MPVFDQHWRLRAWGAALAALAAGAGRSEARTALRQDAEAA